MPLITDKLTQFANQSTVSPVFAPNGNSPWAQRYAQELREVVLRYAARMPRSLQRHLGPSELGHHCDRQLVGKMAGVSFRDSSSGNVLHDPWASIMGTAGHAFLEQAFDWATAPGALHPGRWLTETRVCPDPQALSPHPGTADLFDQAYNALIDHKFQSTNIRNRLRRHGPPYHYYIQMLLYAVGYLNLGYNVQRVVLASWPRTEHTLDGLFLWEKPLTADDLREVLAVLDKTRVREALAAHVVKGELTLWDIPATPSDDDCQYCPFFNPAALKEGTSAGCPGMSLN